MLHNWVQFCEQEIPVTWDPNAVGKRILRRPRRFRSVPFIHAAFNGKHLKRPCKRWRSHSNGSRSIRRCTGRDKRHRRSRERRGRRGRSRESSRSPSRLRHEDEDCDEPPHRMAIPDKCQTHILDHMRCNCPACMDFACKWRKAIMRDFRENVRHPSSPYQRKPQRWAPRLRPEGLGERNDRRFLSRSQSICASPCTRKELKPRHRVSWWFGDNGDDDYACERYTENNCPISEGEQYRDAHQRLDVFDGDPQLLRWNQKRCSQLYPRVSAKEKEYAKNKQRHSGFDDVALDGTFRKSTLKAKRDDEGENTDVHKEDTLVLRNFSEGNPSNRRYRNYTKRHDHRRTEYQENIPDESQTKCCNSRKSKPRIRSNDNDNKRQEKTPDCHEKSDESSDGSFTRPNNYHRAYSSPRSHNGDNTHGNRRYSQSHNIVEKCRKKHGLIEMTNDKIRTTRNTMNKTKPMEPRGCVSPGCESRYSDTTSNAIMNSRRVRNDTDVLQSHSSPGDSEFRACRPFCPSDKVMKLPKTKNEREWFARHLDLMNECGLECHATARERTRRMLEKADGMRRSLNKTSLDFGDMDTRLEKMRTMQKDYLNTSTAVLNAIRDDTNAARRGQSSERDYVDDRSNPQRSFNNNDDDDDHDHDDHHWKCLKTYRSKVVPDWKNTRHCQSDKLCRKNHGIAKGLDDEDELKERYDAILGDHSSPASNISQNSDLGVSDRKSLSTCDKRSAGKNDDKSRDLRPPDNGQKRKSPSRHFVRFSESNNKSGDQGIATCHHVRYNSDGNNTKHSTNDRRAGEKRDSVKLPPYKRGDKDSRTYKGCGQLYSNDEKEDHRYKLYSRHGDSPLVFTNNKGILYFTDEGMSAGNKQVNGIDGNTDGGIFLHRLSGNDKCHSNAGTGNTRDKTRRDCIDLMASDDTRKGKLGIRRREKEDDDDENINVASYNSPCIRSAVSLPSFRRRKTSRDKWSRQGKSDITGYDSDEEESEGLSPPHRRLTRRRRICNRSCSCRNKNCNRNTDDRDEEIGISQHSENISSFPPYSSMIDLGSKQRHYGKERRSPLIYLDSSIQDGSDLQSSGYFSD